VARGTQVKSATSSSPGLVTGSTGPPGPGTAGVRGWGPWSGACAGRRCAPPAVCRSARGPAHRESDGSAERPLIAALLPRYGSAAFTPEAGPECLSPPGPLRAPAITHLSSPAVGARAFAALTKQASASVQRAGASARSHSPVVSTCYS
jgi:hypothetical protein